MADCKHDNLRVFREAGENGNFKAVDVCKKCGRFLVAIVGDIQYFDFEFALSDLDQAIAATKRIFDRNGLQIVLASTNNETLRDIVCRAFDEVVQAERQRATRPGAAGED